MNEVDAFITGATIFPVEVILEHEILPTTLIDAPIDADPEFIIEVEFTVEQNMDPHVREFVVQLIVPFDSKFVTVQTPKVLAPALIVPEFVSDETLQAPAVNEFV